MLSWSWMLSAASFSLLQGFWDGCTDDNVQFPLLWGPLVKSWCHKWKCGCSALWGVCAHRWGSRAVLTGQGWSALENKVNLCHLSSLICESLAQANARSCWLASSCEIYLFNSKRIAKGSEHLLSRPQCEQVTCTEEMTHATCSQKAHHCLQRTKAPPQSILQLLSHSFWQRDSLS